MWKPQTQPPLTTADIIREQRSEDTEHEDLGLLFSVQCIKRDYVRLLLAKKPRATTCNWLGLKPNSPMPLCVYLPVSVSRLTPLTLSGCQIACQKPSIKYNDKPSNTSPHEFKPEWEAVVFAASRQTGALSRKHTHTFTHIYTHRSPAYQNNDQWNVRWQYVSMININMSGVKNIIWRRNDQSEFSLCVVCGENTWTQWQKWLINESLKVHLWGAYITQRDQLSGGIKTPCLDHLGCMLCLSP